MNCLSKLFLFTFFFVSICVSSASACECKEKPSFDDALENATAVFIGRVEEKKLSGRRPGFYEVKFIVFPKRKFKGFDELPPTKFTLVHTPAETVDCGIDFAPGFEYLVYVSGNPAFLKTTSCDRTEVLDKAMEDQEKLLRVSPSK